MGIKGIMIQNDSNSTRHGLFLQFDYFDKNCQKYNWPYMSNQNVSIEIDSNVHRNVKIVYETLVNGEWILCEKNIDPTIQTLSLKGFSNFFLIIRKCSKKTFNCSIIRNFKASRLYRRIKF